MALSANVATRRIEFPDHSLVQPLYVAAAVHAYEGGALFRDPSGNAVLTSNSLANPFLGIAENEYDNSSGGITTTQPVIARWGHVEEVTITGVTRANIGDLVYATDDNSYKLTLDANSVVVGKVYDVNGANTARVHFQRLEDLI